MKKYFKTQMKIYRHLVVQVPDLQDVQVLVHVFKSIPYERISFIQSGIDVLIIYHGLPSQSVKTNPHEDPSSPGRAGPGLAGCAGTRACAAAHSARPPAAGPAPRTAALPSECTALPRPVTKSNIIKSLNYNIIECLYPRWYSYF